MLLSNQEESALLQVYDTYWHSYLTGDISTLASLLADDYTQIGSVETEVFDNKKDAVHFIETTIDQVAGKLEMRNRVKKVEPVGPITLITEQTDLYVLTEGGWVYYAKFRASSFLQKNDGQWKFIHQHSSMPDIRADEGENIATEKISRENIELRDAIKRRTVELEQKNLELAIEASLERVRTMAMGMRKPDDLPGICEVLYSELRSMGFTELRNAMINIHDDEKNSFINYDYSHEIGQSVNHLSYNIHPVIEKQINQIRSTHDAFSETVFSGQDLADWKAFRKRIGEKEDPRIDDVSALYYYFYSIGTGAIGVSTFGPISSEKLEQLKRFRNVFEFAYRRYMDVTQAEAQAREAQIEAALERVRSKTMAMHNSQDVGDTVATMFEQLRGLGVSTNRCGILIFGDTGVTEVWTAKENKEGKAALIIGYLDLTIHPMLFGAIDAWKNNEAFFSYELAGEDIRDYYTSINNFPGYPTKFNLDSLPASEIHSDFYFPEGSVFAFTAEPIPTESALIFKRFAGVFGQTYRRYLDLQKAEAQARESQVQLALERVRARTMAMQQSSELSEVVFDLYQQMQYLGFDYGACTITLIDESTGDTDWWMAGLDNRKYPNRYHVNHFSHPGYQAILNEWKRGDDFGIIEIKGESKKQYDQILFTQSDFAKLSDDIKSLMTSFDSLTYSMAFMRYGCLSFGPNPISELEKNILQRFARVFEQTYTRFLDLQKAEAQAREAQIEAALERVRSRSMAMQKSGELGEVKQLVLEQLQKLNIKIDGLSMLLDFGKSRDWNIWAAVQGGIYNDILHIPYIDNAAFNGLLDTYHAGLDFHAGQISFEEKNQLFDHYFRYAGDVPEERKEYVFSTEGFSASTYFLKNSVLRMHTFTLTPYTASENDVLKRIAFVFDQAYTRFLDLQKAETQARESQIELGLERVRARAMAMQDSGELSDLVATLLHELTKLDFSLTFCIINIYNEPDHSNMVWAANPQEGKAPESYYMKFEDYPFHHAMMREWKAGTPKYVYVMEGKEKEIYDDYLYTDTEFRRFPKEIQTANRALDRYVASFVFSQFGGLQTVGNKPLSDESLEILYRFGKVFDQTYTRFLDLQKAEAQARESQIQLAMERVRARTMAMQKSNELGETAALLFQQLHSLDLDFWSADIIIWRTDDDNLVEDWMGNSTDGSALTPILLRFKEDDKHRNIYEASLRGELMYEEELKGEALTKHYEWFKSHPSANMVLEKLENYGITPPPVQWNYAAIFKQGYLLIIAEEPEPDLRDISKLFAKTFEQTYTRFLDLQKAEAQARDAKIEAALERVRSRAMAMQQSSELSILIELVYKEMGALDLILQRCFIMIFNQSNNSFTWWMASNEAGSSQRSYFIQHHELRPHLEYIKGWKEQNPKWEYHLFGREKEEWDAFLFKETQLAQLPPEIIQNMTGTPYVYLHSSFSNFGCICAASVEPLRGDYFDIINRFSKVFDQTYTRFLDLQKAEAQAREATIEASLEKVRGKALAMQNSNDLIATASIVFTEIKNLGIQSFRTGVGLLTKANRNAILYSATSKDKGDNLSLVGSAMLEGHEVLSQLYDCWIANEDCFPVLKGEQLRTYIEKLNPTFTLRAGQTEDYIHYGCFLPFSEGMFYSWSDKAYAEAEIKILQRFRAIIDLTFRRFVELQKAEANALEAVRRASIDRVRAEIASMRTTTDLDRITPLIWKELTILGIPFVRCGVFIMDEQEELIHTFLSTPDGRAIAAIHLPYQSSPLADSLTFWREKKIYLTHWGSKEYAEFADAFIGKTELERRAQFLSSVPNEGIYLHLLPFLQGMLYVGNTTQLEEESLHLIQSVAHAFSTAYARYEDFVKLEAAKTDIEAAMAELKATQSQLVQQEKLASLGQLTAGIAHEIKNPLNFVNNFSELNLELIQEAMTEIRKSSDSWDETLIDGILTDIQSNLQKVYEHGSRANGIVNSMLQHSRGGSGQMEPTKLNVFLKEYVHFCFQGMRAGKHPIPVEVEWDLSTEVGEVPLIREDFSRVIVNISNNAFDAMRSKLQDEQKEDKDYVPLLVIRTKKEKNFIRVSFQDNGPGIPGDIKDKILQPFFTTKKGTDGTGLGLSITHDIVKAHGGELTVENKEDGGCVFILTLPFGV